MRESTEDRMIQILEVVAKELSEIKIACKQCDPAQMQDDLRTLSGVAVSLESVLPQMQHDLQTLSGAAMALESALPEEIKVTNTSVKPEADHDETRTSHKGALR